MFYFTEKSSTAPVSQEVVLLLDVSRPLSQEDGVEPGGVDDLLGLHLLAGSEVTCYSLSLIF